MPEPYSTPMKIGFALLLVSIFIVSASLYVNARHTIFFDSQLFSFDYGLMLPDLNPQEVTSKKYTAIMGLGMPLEGVNNPGLLMNCARFLLVISIQLLL